MVTGGAPAFEDVAPIDGLCAGSRSGCCHCLSAARLHPEGHSLYVASKPGMALSDIPVDRVFNGSYTNGRLIVDLLPGRQRVARTRWCSAGRRRSAWVVAGSGLVKEQAEAEGLDGIFLQAGFKWRDAGCVCSASAPSARPRCRRASAAPRPRIQNFAGCQGRGACTDRMSPAMELPCCPDQAGDLTSASSIGENDCGSLQDTSCHWFLSPCPGVNVETDQIIPGRFSSKPRAGGFPANDLFHDLRFDSNGKEQESFVPSIAAALDAMGASFTGEETSAADLLLKRNAISKAGPMISASRSSLPPVLATSSTANSSKNRPPADQTRLKRLSRRL